MGALDPLFLHHPPTADDETGFDCFWTGWKRTWRQNQWGEAKCASQPASGQRGESILSPTELEHIWWQDCCRTDRLLAGKQTAERAIARRNVCWCCSGGIAKAGISAGVILWLVADTRKWRSVKGASMMQQRVCHFLFSCPKLVRATSFQCSGNHPIPIFGNHPEPSQF